jgi:serine phosphatase RsbU (regulator of sigma subunit)
VAAGGHPPPVVLRSSGAVEAVGGYGTLLGIFPDPSLLDRAVELAPGEAIVLYTDGVTEPFARESLDVSPLGSLLSGLVGMDAEAIADRLEAKVLEDSNEELRDDVCILVVRTAAAGSPERASPEQATVRAGGHEEAPAAAAPAHVGGAPGEPDPGQ